MNKLVMSLLLIIIANIGTWFQFQGHYWLDKPFLKSLTFVMLSLKLSSNNVSVF